MTRIIVTKADLKATLIPLIAEEFSMGDFIVRASYDTSIGSHINELIDTTVVFIESPYIDKVYRDSYYTYYSSKRSSYKKNCIRLSFFDGEIRDELFRNVEGIREAQEKYLGFIIIRPIEPYFLGRSVIHPKGVKNNDFLSVQVTIQATVNSIKLITTGFPHSSQDTETITCAETTLWALMEYFGNKYPDYKPVYPSKIIDALKKVSSERQIPSRGLNIQQMAFALKEFGFGTRIYSKAEFGDPEFKRLFSTYIESGIPLICAVENRRRGGDIGHAILCIGKEKTTDAQIDNLNRTAESNQYILDQINNKGLQFFDNDDIYKDFIFIDDNRPIYQRGKLDTPTIHYPENRWHNCEITHFVVPLYSKVYLEAFKAKSFFKRILLDLFPIANGSEIFIRFYLSSSRSFKHALALNDTFDQNTKDLLLEASMPKFIWIGEISTKTLIKQQRADGIVILDATEANMQSMKGLIAASYVNNFIFYNSRDKQFQRIPLPLQSFSIFTHNLNGF